MKSFLIGLFFISSMPSFATIVMKKDVSSKSLESCKDANRELATIINELRKNHSVTMVKLGTCNKFDFFEDLSFVQSATVEYAVGNVLGSY